MAIQALKEKLSSGIELVKAKTSKLTRRQTMTLAVFTLLIGSLVAYAKFVASERKQEHPATAIPTQIGDISTEGSSANTGAKIGPGTHGPAIIVSNTGENGVSVGAGTVFQYRSAPMKYREQCYVQSSGPKYPILMSNSLGESNIIKADHEIKKTLVELISGQRVSGDPIKLGHDMLDQIGLTDGTEVDELKADLEQELKVTPEIYRASARLWASSHTKVLVKNGQFSGHSGWVASSVIRRKRVEAE